MGLPYGINNCNGKINQEDSFAILHKAIDSGISLLNTAESYGDANQLIGDFHMLNSEIKFCANFWSRSRALKPLVAEISAYKFG